MNHKEWKAEALRLADDMQRNSYRAGCSMGGGLEQLAKDEATLAAHLDKRPAMGERVPVAWVIPGDDNARADGFLDAMAFKHGEFTRPLYAAPQAPAIPLKERPDFIEGYHAGMKDGRACAERDAPDVLALLREAQDVIAKMADGPQHANWGEMLDRIDAVMREHATQPPPAPAST